MKKILFSIAALAVAFGFTACSNEDETLGVKGGKTTVLAMTEAGTRTALADDGEGAYNVVWSEGDKIYISDGHSQYKEFELKSGAGETTATFEGETPADGEYYAFYATRFATFESTQYYEAGKVCNFPMCASAKVEDGKIKPLEFWNLGGMLSLTVKGTATIKSIQVTSEQSMAGPIGVSQNDHTATCSYDCKKVTLDCGDGVALTAEGTVFNIALLANTYKGVQITLTDIAGNTLTKTFKGTDGLKIERSKITKASFTASFPPAGSRGSAKATIGGSEVDVNWVQLWKDGPKFAVYNVGATSVTEYGGYYTWGGTYNNNSALEGFEWHSDRAKGVTNLSGDTDTATKLWGPNWRMPTKDELGKEEKISLSKKQLIGGLLYECTFTWVNDYNGTGVNGVLCTGKGDYLCNSIFLPAAGIANNVSGTPEMSGQSTQCRYWTSVENKKDYSSYCLSITNSNQTMNEYGYYYLSQSVRAVLNEY